MGLSVHISISCDICDAELYDDYDDSASDDVDNYLSHGSDYFCDGADCCCSIEHIAESEQEGLTDYWPDEYADNYCICENCRDEKLEEFLTQAKDSRDEADGEPENTETEDAVVEEEKKEKKLLK